MLLVAPRCIVGIEVEAGHLAEGLGPDRGRLRCCRRGNLVYRPLLQRVDAGLDRPA
jgi:hypothetical protein